MAIPYIPALKSRFVTVEIDDVSTAGQKYVVPGFNGRIKKIWSVLNGPITVANAILTPKIGGTAVTGGAITIAYDGSAAGDVDSAIPTALHRFAEGQAIEIETDGGSTDTAAAVVTIELVPE